MKTLALVAAMLIAALGLTRPAAADGWGAAYPPQGFAPPPSISLFSGNAPSAFYPPVPRRYCASPKRVFNYGRGYGYPSGYISPRYGRSYGGSRTVIIVTR